MAQMLDHSNTEKSGSKNLAKFAFAFTVFLWILYTIFSLRLGSGVSSSELQVLRKTHRLPSALIIGARKAGTRALLSMIGLNSQVVPCPREVHFFDRDNNYERGLEWYISHMPLSTFDQLVIEKSPSYLTSPTTPRRVFRMDRDIKLIVILRDPVERLISDFTQLSLKRLKYDLPMRNFTEAALHNDGTVRVESALIRTSIYHRHLRRWLRFFPRSSLLVVDGDLLTTQPTVVIERVERFLRLPRQVGPDNFVYNSTKGFYCLRNKTQSSSESGDPDGNAKCLAHTKGLKHVNVDERVKRMLRHFFASHNNKLYRLIGHDFRWPVD